MYGDSDHSDLALTGRFLAGRTTLENLDLAESSLASTINVSEDVKEALSSTEPGRSRESFSPTVNRVAIVRIGPIAGDVSLHECAAAQNHFQELYDLEFGEAQDVHWYGGTIPLSIDVDLDDDSYLDVSASPYTIFKIADLLRDRQTEQEIENARTAVPHDGPAIGNRLAQLAEFCKEESAETISPASIRSFVRFLATKNVSRPDGISVDADGLVWATWRQSTENYLALRFYEDGRISFSAAVPTKKTFGKGSFVSGMGGENDALELIQKSFRDWIIGVGSTMNADRQK